MGVTTALGSSLPASPLPPKAPDETGEGGYENGEGADMFRREGHGWGHSQHQIEREIGT